MEIKKILHIIKNAPYQEFLRIYCEPDVICKHDTYKVFGKCDNCNKKFTIILCKGLEAPDWISMKSWGRGIKCTNCELKRIYCN